MTIYRSAKSRFWQYDFQVAGQRYHGSTGTESKTAARDHERKLRSRIAAGADRKPDITLDEAGGLYWSQRGQFERNSATTRYQLRKLNAGLGRSILLRDLDRQTLERFVARRRGEKARNRDALVSNATVNRELQLLRRVCRHVGETYEVATINWGKLLLSEPRERVRELSADEEARLFAELDPDLAAVVEFAMLSGQRRSSIITMLWSKVDLAGARAEVRVKGGHWHQFPLTPRMVALIANRPKAAAQVFTYECRRPAPPRAGRPGRLRGQRYPFSLQGWTRRWRKALADAGVDDFRFHDLRHTTGTRVLRATGNLKVVQRLLDHTVITTTARYAHALEDDVRAALIETESRNSPGPSSRGIAENGRNTRTRG